jgi:hypothetical protein
MFPLGSPALRTRYDIWDRPSYGYGIFSAAVLARNLGIDSLSAIEFGVAGGNGLLSMERIARQISAYFGGKPAIKVLGFDTGQGMPPPRDYRDLPHVWQAGFYRMEVEKLRSRLAGAELILGDVDETIAALLEREDFPPVGFVAFDVDYYSSTKSALKLFAHPSHRTRLPRVYCYFDDIIYPENACHNEFTGELLAIREFNEEFGTRKLARINGLSWIRPVPASWNDQIYVLHDFEHPLYCESVTPKGEQHSQIPLKGT